MGRRLLTSYALSIATCLPVTQMAQVAGGEQQQSARNHIALPSWLKLSVELRGRAESADAFDPASRDGLYLNRLRLDVAVQPTPWVQLYFQGQDARVFGLNTLADRDAFRNTFDIRQVYVGLGTPEEGWHLRVGRQELALGDERLVGADNYWDAFGQAFDAVRIAFAKPRYRVEAFTGFRVQPASRRLDSFDAASRISGLSVQLRAPGGAILEPYLLWKRGGDTLDLWDRPGHRDVVTPGVRALGDLPRSLDYNVEMALQRGHVVADGIAAWAGHWELGWKPLGRDTGPRLGLEYNFASCDKDPGDQRHGTFDDLYPAGFNKFGMSDPFAWRNIRYPAIAIEIPITGRWTAYTGYRYFQLANTQDGLYPGGDQYMVRNPEATSTEVGSHVLVSASYTHSAHWRLFAGYGYIFPGAYLRQSGYMTPLRTAYLQSSFTY